MFRTLDFLQDAFRSPRELVAFLSAYGAEAPNVEAVGKWFQRGAIPSSWLPVLLAYMELEHGSPITLAPYLGERR